MGGSSCGQQTARSNGGVNCYLIDYYLLIATTRKFKLISKACQLTDQILARTLPYLKAGVSEKTVAKKIVHLTKERGCGLSFYPIIAFGRWSAYPHHKAGKRRLRRNDLVLIDLGAKYKGYCADLTRTFTFGPPDKKQKAMIELVLKAQTFAIKKIKAGTAYREADQLIRGYFVRHGVKPDLIRHGLGHGIGRRVHEGFILSVKTPQDGRLKIGGIFTLEPGLYLKGWGGVRIEDTGVLTKGGVKQLTRFPKKNSIPKPIS